MRARDLVVLFVIAALSGCAPAYRYRGVQYPSPAGVIAAHQRDLDNVINSIEGRSAPVASRARVIIPSKGVILDRGVKPAGSAELRDYLATIFHNNVRFVPRAIMKRNLFERVDVEESAAPDFVRPTPPDAVEAADVIKRLTNRVE